MEGLTAVMFGRAEHMLLRSANGATLNVEKAGLFTCVGIYVSSDQSRVHPSIPPSIHPSATAFHELDLCKRSRERSEMNYCLWML